jgi:signal recognition particle GTPase
MEVVFGWQLQSGAEPEAAPVPLPRVLSRAHQALHETEAAILREWEALEAEHQRLSDWCTQVEERTKAVSRQFASERSELEQDRKDYKRDLQKVYARELEASRREKKLARRDVGVSQREALTTELQAKLSALDKILEEKRIQQTTTVERLQKFLDRGRRTSLGGRRTSPGGRRISPSGRKCSHGEASCWLSTSSRRRRKKKS